MHKSLGSKLLEHEGLQMFYRFQNQTACIKEMILDHLADEQAQGVDSPSFGLDCCWSWSWD